MNQIFSLLDPFIFRYIIDRYATKFHQYTISQLVRGVSLLLGISARIYYTPGNVDREYEPDLIVETKTGKWICETKKASEMADPEVQAKAQASALWCQHATDATGESWGYLLIPHDHVRMSMAFAGFVAGWRIGYSVSLDSPHIGQTP